MNIHHLELFYFVARSGGISQAVRKIPYGIQQPAISAQILQLEETLGTKLFQRRPFQLTEAGTRLFAFITPFFSQLDEMAASLRGRETHLRVGASTAVLRDHLPEVLRALQSRLPGLRLTLHEGIEPELLAELDKAEIDLAVTTIDRKPAQGLCASELLKLPLILLVPATSKIRGADELWKHEKIEEPLITPPPGEALTRCFQRGLAQRQLEWATSIRVNSLEIIERYVQNGFGIGLSVRIPGKLPAKGVRIIELEDFEPVTLCALWRGTLNPPLQMLVEQLQAHAAALAGFSGTLP